MRHIHHVQHVAYCKQKNSIAELNEIANIFSIPPAAERLFYKYLGDHGL